MTEEELATGQEPKDHEEDDDEEEEADGTAGGELIGCGLSFDVSTSTWRVTRKKGDHHCFSHTTPIVDCL